MNYLALTMILIFTGCQKSPEWRTTLNSSATPSAPDRVAFMKKVMRDSPPSEIIDANYLQQAIGDGSFGPSDRRFYACIRIKPDKITAWKQRTRKLKLDAGEWPTPTHRVNWWPNTITPDMEFHEVEKWLPGNYGFLAINTKTPEFIYIFSYSM